MDFELQNKIAELKQHLKSFSTESLDYNQLDPIARMMLVALMYETQKIEDAIDRVSQKITEKYCEDFIPRDEVGAMPAVAIVAPMFRKNKMTEVVSILPDTSFSLRQNGVRNSPCYLPLFLNTLIPYDDIYVLTPHRLKCSSRTLEISMESENVLWVGINSKAEVETLRNFSIFVKGITGVAPQRVSVCSVDYTSLSFSLMDRMEDIDMSEPFDAQQATTIFMSLIKQWRQLLLSMPQGTLFYITDTVVDRDVFKKKNYPKVFQNWLESEVLDCFDGNTMWFKIEFPEGFTVPDDCEVVLNTIPVVNIDINNITLTQTAPIAKLQKQDDSFFIQVMETSNTAQKQGFVSMSKDIILRDFDASCYHNGDLYREVRNLYNHFVEDYYAFIEYNALKDGDDIRRLKELINKIGKSVGKENSKYKFDSGTYAMKNIDQYPQASTTKVSFMTTQGARGNILSATLVGGKDARLECKKLPVMETETLVIVDAMGGRDKANADTRYEQLRYYSLTNDRLYTKIDVEAFVRKALMETFGREEFKRIYIKITIQGAIGQSCVQRGLYVDIEFKDKKNYEKACKEVLDIKLQQAIQNKSCISMPINITLLNRD